MFLSKEYYEAGSDYEHTEQGLFVKYVDSLKGGLIEQARLSHLEAFNDYKTTSNLNSYDRDLRAHYITAQLIQDDGPVPQAFQDDFIRIYLRTFGSSRYVVIKTKKRPDIITSDYDGIS